MQSKECYNPRYTQEQKDRIIKAYEEKSSMRGIQRTFGLARQTLAGWLKKKAQKSLKLADTLVTAKRSDVLELDEMWSFSGSKKEQCWLWVALCRRTRQIVGWAFGNRGLFIFNLLRESMPKSYQNCASFSDFWDCYDAIFPKNTSVDKKSGQTAHIERFNLTLRQRVGRVVRKTLSYSKKLENHIQAIKMFVINYNLEINKSFAI